MLVPMGELPVVFTVLQKARHLTERGSSQLHSLLLVESPLKTQALVIDSASVTKDELRVILTNVAYL